MTKYKNIIMLSEKSSGSSACQKLLTRFADIRHINKTRHFESETLYWTKAASIMGKPQLKMVDSEVPIPPERAKSDLISLLRDNLDNYDPPECDLELINHGYNLLCKTYSPIFIEKSPHHLCQWSAIELIVNHIRQIKDVDFLLLGLVRNPMDTIYSQFTRWGSRPEMVESQWIVAYRNLLKLREMDGIQLQIVRYEDIVSSIKHLSPVFDFCEVKPNVDDQVFLHQKSLSKWKNDRRFKYVLSEQAIEVAEAFGYKKNELIPKTNSFWRFLSGRNN